MRKLIILCLLTGPLFIQAQQKNWSLELSYPISVGEDFGSSNEGRVAAGLKYRFAQIGKFRVGASLDASWFSTKLIEDSNPVQEQTFRDFFLQPRFFAELPIAANNKLKLYGALGWTFSRTLSGVVFFNEEGQAEGIDWRNGPNLNLGVSYDLSSHFFLHGQYDLIFLNGEGLNSSAGLLKLGAGFRF